MSVDVCTIAPEGDADNQDVEDERTRVGDGKVVEHLSQGLPSTEYLWNVRQDDMLKQGVRQRSDEKKPEPCVEATFLRAEIRRTFLVSIHVSNDGPIMQQPGPAGENRAALTTAARMGIRQNPTCARCDCSGDSAGSDQGIGTSFDLSLAYNTIR
jgi:hypothetical protein